MMKPPSCMKWIDADSVEEKDILLRDGAILRIVKIEWPYAVVREYEHGEFGERRVIPLAGNYFVPSDEFLSETGVFESRLVQEEDNADFVLDVHDVLGATLADGERETESGDRTGAKD